MIVKRPSYELNNNALDVVCSKAWGFVVADSFLFLLPLVIGVLCLILVLLGSTSVISSLQF